jgi:BirA family biotin operon repressor/biotin-[acetyl-CoA-carboxylase] ligase
LLRFILGIGVNLNQQSFPPELQGTATSLLRATGRPFAHAEFRNQLLSRLAHWYGRWQGHEGRAVIERWQELSSYAYGQQVVITLDNEQLTGETAGLTESGALLVRTGAGEMRTILAGEVARLRKHDAW